MIVNNPSQPYFEKVAGEWDSLRTGYFTEAVRDVAIAKAWLHPSMKVADVGSGTGFMATGLAPLVSQVTALDGSPAMLEVARSKLAAFENVEYQVADGQSLPLPDASQDAAFANMYLHHAPDPQAAIREMVRILRPGGRLVITDLDAHEHAWMKEEMADLWLGFDRAELRKWFEEAGLVNVIIDDTDQTCQSERQTSINIFVATGTKRIVARDSVQASYAARATESDCGCDSDCCQDGTRSTDCGCGSGCCSPGSISLEDVGTVNWDGGYTAAEMSDVPAEAAGFSLGCGNPVAMAGLKQGEVVLDIGSGGGLDSFLAARQVGPTGFVYGIDMTPAMLQRARKAAKKGGFENVKFRHGYAENLPVKDGEIDVILSNCVINLTEDKAKVFAEAYRVLKPGGRLEVNDMVFGGSIPPAARLSANGWSECISGALPEGEYLDLVKQAGFTDVQVRRSTSAGSSTGVPVYSVQVSAQKTQ